MQYHLNAPAKVNLHLEIGPATDNGYHVLRSLCVKVNLYDHLTVEITSQGYTLTGLDIPNLTPEQDILYKSMVLFQELSGRQFGLKIHLEKTIPMCGGLGGGSSDAGVLLNFLNNYFHRPIFLPILAQKSGYVGADIPLFVYPYAAMWIEGIGEHVKQLASRPLDILLCFPHASISTKEAYAYVDHYVEPLGKLSSTEAWQAWTASPRQWPFFNTFSQRLRKSYPFIEQSMEFLQKFDFDYIQMSGSGSTIFAVGNQGTIQSVLQQDMRHLFTSCRYVKTLDNYHTVDCV